MNRSEKPFARHVLHVRRALAEPEPRHRPGRSPTATSNVLLTDLEASGLHELETEWRDSLLKLSGNDLTSLDSELARSVREIRDRIDPVNGILADLPFADDDHRLRIDAQREPFRGVRPGSARSYATSRVFIDGAATDNDRDRAYHRMAKVIDRIRRTAPDFADLVDVRNHVRISAEKRDLDGDSTSPLRPHRGEVRRRVTGAGRVHRRRRTALPTGDAGAERPRYAPVFLDEALIKADAHFTGRAIGAWRGLGFQLIIGAPNDKHSAIEPHVDVEYLILKNTKGRSWAKPVVGLPDPHDCPPTSLQTTPSRPSVARSISAWAEASLR